MIDGAIEMAIFTARFDKRCLHSTRKWKRTKWKLMSKWFDSGVESTSWIDSINFRARIFCNGPSKVSISLSPSREFLLFSHQLDFLLVTVSTDISINNDRIKYYEHAFAFILSLGACVINECAVVVSDRLPHYYRCYWHRLVIYFFHALCASMASYRQSTCLRESTRNK